MTKRLNGELVGDTVTVPLVGDLSHLTAYRELEREGRITKIAVVYRVNGETNGTARNQSEAERGRVEAAQGSGAADGPGRGAVDAEPAVDASKASRKSAKGRTRKSQRRRRNFSDTARLDNDIRSEDGGEPSPRAGVDAAGCDDGKTDRRRRRGNGHGNEDGVRRNGSRVARRQEKETGPENGGWEIRLDDDGNKIVPPPVEVGLDAIEVDAVRESAKAATPRQLELKGGLRKFTAMRMQLALTKKVKAHFYTDLKLPPEDWEIAVVLNGTVDGQVQATGHTRVRPT